MAHLRTGLSRYLLQLPATETVISKYHGMSEWISHAVTFRLVELVYTPWLANTHFHVVCTIKSRQHIIFAPLTSTLVALRPQTPPNIDRDYLCNRHMKRFRLYRTQWIETEAVNPINTILRKFHPRHGSAPMLDRTVYPAASGHCNIEEHYWSKG